MLFGFASHDAQLGLTHDIRLCPDRNQTVNMFADGYQHLARHVATLLGTGGLVLDVDSSSTLLDEQLGQLHHCRQAAVARVRVRDDGTEVVDVCQVGTLRRRGRQALLSLLAVMEELCHEQMRNLVGDGGLFNAGKHGKSLAESL